MDRSDPKVVLQHYLTLARDALRWKLEGLSDYDVRRPLTPTGTNLLGIVKHLACVELAYFGDVFDRPHGIAFPGDENELNADMYATAKESREFILDLYKRATAHADAVIAEFPIGHPGRVPWWPDDVSDVSLHLVISHLIAETNRHLGHVDILREQLDGATGHREHVANLPDVDAEYWSGYVEHLDRIARTANG